MSLYFMVMAGSLIGPFLLSFDKKIHFYTYWKALFPAIFVVAIPFIIWDEIFTSWGLWGFNSEHLNGFFVGNLPIEEVCFFFFVPYACIFIYEVLIGYFKLARQKQVAKLFTFVILLSSMLIGILYFDRLYTVVSCSMALILTYFAFFRYKVKWFGVFAITFLVVQIPFFVVNGILTGMMTDEPIVWYNLNEISNIRMGTIPIEDIFYNYAMLLLIFAVYVTIKKKKGMSI